MASSNYGSVSENGTRRVSKYINMHIYLLPFIYIENLLSSIKISKMTVCMLASTIVLKVASCKYICTRNDKLAIRWSLGCVNPASWLPLAAGCEFTQPRDHSCPALYTYLKNINLGETWKQPAEGRGLWISIYGAKSCWTSCRLWFRSRTTRILKSNTISESNNRPNR